jgi:hypothetical protein
MRHYNRSSRTTVFSQNFLWIGHQAWQGYLNCDRGVVAISSQVDLLDNSDPYRPESTQPSLNFRYIPAPQLSIYLQEWLVPERAIDDISIAVANYQPHSELIFAVESHSQLDIGWCQRLKISPPDCYQQIQRRWSEFEVRSRG